MVTTHNFRHDTIASNQDLPTLISTLFETQQALQRKGEAATPEEQALLSALQQSLQSLHQWITISASHITLDMLRERTAWMCERYNAEMQCWMEDSQETLPGLIKRIAVFHAGEKRLAPPSQENSQTKSARFVSPLSEEDANAQARLLKALADPHRMRILSLLSRHEGEVCVFELVEAFTLEQPTISHHLRILRDAGLVDCHKKGLWAYYYVKREALERAREAIAGLY